MKVFFSSREQARKAGFGVMCDNGVNAEKGKRFAREVKHDAQMPRIVGTLAQNPFGGFVPVDFKNRKLAIIQTDKA
jgi:hypothetical protein